MILERKLADWLTHLQTLHVKDMDLSLERVNAVASKLGVIRPKSTVITVGGTNGKGSCVAFLESFYKNSGYRVGVFNSPILFRHNEYVRLQGNVVSDAIFCQAYEKIDQVREGITLTQFEFTALAAFWIFKQAELDIWILEVGLGGRFDAVNAIESDLAMVTSIGMDHMEWLGDTREKIAFEKAGIFRSAKPAICGDGDPPDSLINYAKQINTPLYCLNKHFGFKKEASNWSFWCEQRIFSNLPLPILSIQNAAIALMGIELLQTKHPIPYSVLEERLPTVALTGRIQVKPGAVTQIYDVAHNPDAVQLLANWLKEHECQGKTIAVFSMLKDKDILSCLLAIKPVIDEWCIAELATNRAASLALLTNLFDQAEISALTAVETVAEAYSRAEARAIKGDRIVIFGSFHTVAAALSLNNRECIAT